MSIFRRIMLGGGVIDIDTLPDTQKLYYTATAKVTPKIGSFGSAVIANKWDNITSEGIIVCSRDITTINNNAFSGVSALTSITISDSVTSIGTSAFSECSGKITINSKIVEIDYTLNNYPSSNWLKNSKFTELIFGNNIEKIGSYTFYNCDSLTSITIPDSVTLIGEWAFYECTSLTSISIPNSVTSIGSFAFWDCTSMQYYDFSTHESVPTLGNTNAFGGTPSTCKIIVPDALYDKWIVATNWSTYADRIIKKSDWDASQIIE